MALFISFEGGDGAGKTTQAHRLVAKMREECGVHATFVHEPGFTELGGIVRNIVKGGLPSGRPLTDNAELLLFSAARSELVAKVLEPALARDGESGVVVADRYVDSTTAYQGYGRGIDLALVSAVNALATRGVMPHLTFLLDMPPMQAMARMGGMQMGFSMDSGADSPFAERYKEGARFEEQPMEFHSRIREGYRAMAAREPERWHAIDAAADEDAIAAAVWEETRRRFPSLDAKPDGAGRCAAAAISEVSEGGRAAK